MKNTEIPSLFSTIELLVNPSAYTQTLIAAAAQTGKPMPPKQYSQMYIIH